LNISEKVLSTFLLTSGETLRNVVFCKDYLMASFLRRSCLCALLETQTLR